MQAVGILPDQSTVRALQRIAWSSCAAGLQLVHAPYEAIHQAMDQLHGCVIGGEGDRLVPDVDDVAVCREALEVLSVCLALCPDAVDVLYKERVWQTFIIDVLLVCRNRLPLLSRTILCALVVSVWIFCYFDLLRSIQVFKLDPVVEFIDKHSIFIIKHWGLMLVETPLFGCWP